MVFNKWNFIKKHGEKAFLLVLDFLDVEACIIQNTDFDFMLNGNFLSFEFDCNMYRINKSHENENKIQLIDHVTEENSQHPSNFTRLTLDDKEFLEIIKDADKILAYEQKR